MRDETMNAHREHLRFTETYSAVHQLSDGTAIRLRLLRADDRERLLEAFGKLSDESRYRRFFTPLSELSDSILGRLLGVDGWNHVAVIAEAVSGDSAAPELFGIARFIRLDGMPDTAEAAIAVADQVQRRGLGKLLLSVTAAAARERGITKFRAAVLTSNEGVRALLHELDGHLAPVSVESGVAVYEVPLSEITAPETMPNAVVQLLRTAARGLEVLFRRLDERAEPSQR